MKTKYTNLAIVYFFCFFPHFWQLKTFKFTSFPNFEFGFLAKFRQEIISGTYHPIPKETVPLYIEHVEITYFEISFLQGRNLTSDQLKLISKFSPFFNWNYLNAIKWMALLDSSFTFFTTEYEITLVGCVQIFLRCIKIVTYYHLKKKKFNLFFIM